MTESDFKSHAIPPHSFFFLVRGEEEGGGGVGQTARCYERQAGTGARDRHWTRFRPCRILRALLHVTRPTDRILHRAWPIKHGIPAPTGVLRVACIAGTWFAPTLSCCPPLDMPMIGAGEKIRLLQEAGYFNRVAPSKTVGGVLSHSSCVLHTREKHTRPYKDASENRPLGMAGSQGYIESTVPRQRL